MVSSHDDWLRGHSPDLFTEASSGLEALGELRFVILIFPKGTINSSLSVVPSTASCTAEVDRTSPQQKVKAVGGPGLLPTDSQVGLRTT